MTPGLADQPEKCNILLSGKHCITSHLLPTKIEKRINLANSIQEHYCLMHDQFSFSLKQKDLAKNKSAKIVKIKKGLYFKLVTDDEEDD